MRKCRHRSRQGYVFVGGQNWLVASFAPTDNLPYREDCGECGIVMPLGEARDTPETAIELAAAEIAANWDAYQDMRWGTELSGLVGMGTSANAEQYLDICIRERDGGRQDRIRDVRDLEIGLLAREIASHGEQGGER